jgi:putative transposase
MSMDNKSLTHTKWNCTYHIVIIPKYRRKVMYGTIRQDVRRIIIKLCKMQNVELIEGAVCADHVHLYVAIPPKMSVAGFMGYLKGKSALMLFDLHPEYKQRNRDRHFWARGYYCETVGNVNEETIKNYIKEQTNSDRLSGE